MYTGLWVFFPDTKKPTNVCLRNLINIIHTEIKVVFFQTEYELTVTVLPVRSYFVQRAVILRLNKEYFPSFSVE